MLKYQKKVFGYCFGFLNNATLAEDAAQEIFIKTYKSLEKFNFKSSFSTWLYRITFNHCEDLLRKNAREQFDSWQELIEKEGEKIERLFLVSPEEDFSEEDAELVRTLLSMISERYRKILILREIQGLSYQELSEALDCSIDSVKAKLRRARKELQEKIRHLFAVHPV